MAGASTDQHDVEATEHDNIRTVLELVVDDNVNDVVL